MKNGYILFAVTAMVGATPAFAGNVNDPAFGWGTPEDTLKCIRELSDGSKQRVHGEWVSFNGKSVVTPSTATAECTAEVDKRAATCTTDPTMARFLKDDNKNGQKQRQILKLAGADGPRLVCADQAWDRMKMQFNVVPQDKRTAAAKKVQQEERRANAEKAEMPKADKKDATIESMVNQAFKKEYPDAKILKTLIVGSWVTERDAFNKTIGRSIQVVVVNQPKDEKEICEVFSEAWYQEAKGAGFAGPLSERGAGSLSRSDILCSKVK
jgi:hypothetical protein